MNDSRERASIPRDADSLNQDRRRLKRRRIAAGLTLRDAAELAGCHFTTIGKLEQGVNSAEPRILVALAAAYGCEITDLMPPDADDKAKAEPKKPGGVGSLASYGRPEKRASAGAKMPQDRNAKYVCAQCDGPWKPGHTCKAPAPRPAAKGVAA